jgi:hypothetical protein
MHDAKPGQIVPREGEAMFSGVMLRAGGASSIPETSRLNTGGSGILDRPVKPGDDIEYGETSIGHPF